MRRQTSFGGWPAIWASHPIDIDPFCLPVKFCLDVTDVLGGSCGAQDEVILGRKSVFVRRKIFGIAVSAKRYSLSEFDGVAICVDHHDGPDSQHKVLIGLRHEQDRLCLPLYCSFNLDDAGARWQAWGRALTLPLMARDQSGSWAYPFKRDLPLGVYQPIARPARLLLAARRPRMTKFRDTGQPDRAKVLSGTEIIAPY